jgi:hypothetical protein
MSLPATELSRIENLYGLPAFVKAAELEEKPDSAMASNAYVDREREYPVHNKSSCFISNARYWDRSIVDDNADPQIGQELLKAAGFWGILEHVKTYVLEPITYQVKKAQDAAMDDNNFAVVQGNTKLFPVIDGETAQMAAIKFAQSKDKLPLSWRRQGANNLLEKLATYEVSDQVPEQVFDYLQRAAGRGISTASHLAQVMHKRANILAGTKRSKVATYLREAADKVGSQASSRGLCEKTASLLDQVDRATGLFKRYGDDLDTPEIDCHAILLKQAHELLNGYVKLASGNYYTLEDIKLAGFNAFALLNGAHEKVSSHNGTNFDLSKAADYLRQLDPKHASLVESALDAMNIKPAVPPVNPEMFTTK